MMSCMEIINPNESIHLFITKGASIGKTFTLILLIQVLISFYNEHRQSNPWKKNPLLMAYSRKTTFHY
jgi:hypothetical protein